MGKTKLAHSIPLIAVLMALALLGMAFVNFVFVCVVCIVGTAAVLYFVIGLFSLLDKIIDFFYRARP